MRGMRNLDGIQLEVAQLRLNEEWEKKWEEK
jgi:hypothetical protein